MLEAARVEVEEEIQPVAAKILVFETDPNQHSELTQVGELPVPDTEGPEAIVRPRELVFDPQSHDLVILGQNAAESPSATKFLLLSTIAIAFMFGAAAGAATAVRFKHGSMLIAASAVIWGALHALQNERALARVATGP